ncbi:DNA-3-methyladenine glycosylase I [Marinobacterium sp. AK62]|uniref:DNA-3-methyladenine glycosylase I n=1 Tax=Marinobacterium alkalitolerans TaxID=1542925 RepID=A0ABS3ZE24_9GAMM|nr:DNA-3-methyladenine glycosylase I [Marinobacterium alkalitolerans]MBP0049958.1 DNA-3-methyladenine glycosylase I [Marinobacterium alkalitolerans]
MDASTPSPGPCGWAMQSPLEHQYHDHEWGVPRMDDRILFEFLVLESAQAGLSWRTVLEKRGGYRTHYAGFDPEQVAGFGEAEIAAMLADPGIIRNRAKIEASINNARIFLDLQARYGSFAAFLWRYVEGRPIQSAFERMEQIPAQTALSQQLSKDLKREGMRFFGPTIAYAYMQAVGVVNDHLQHCPRYEACKALGLKLPL